MSEQTVAWAVLAVGVVLFVMLRDPRADKPKRWKDE